MKRLLIIPLLASLLFSAPAMAHTSISKTSIEAGQTIQVLPSNFQFSFGQPVGLAALTLKSTAGKSIPLSFDKPKSMQTSFIVNLPDLAPGDYVFHWRAVSKDGHVIKGKIPFSYKPAQP